MLAKEIAEIILKDFNYSNAIGIVVGSGIDISQIIEHKKEFLYKDLGILCSKVEGHSEKFICGFIDNKPVILASRFHYYESGDIGKVRLIYEILHYVGVKVIVLQSSCGALNKTLKPGDICLIKDHINLTGNNPLINYSPLKFLDLSNLYSKEYREIIKKWNKDIKEVVHVQFTGPNYETNAEVQAARLLGGDTVSMSIVYDSLIAKYYEMNIIAFSVITNATGDSNQVSHDEVLEIAKSVKNKMTNIISYFIKNLN